MMNNDDKPIITVRGLEKTFTGSGEPLTILRNLDMDVYPGQKVVIEGSSGSGKSTLLNVIGGLESATAGTITVGPWNITGLTEDQLTRYRSEYLGLVFQFHHLLKDFSALENVFLPAYMAGMKKKDAMEKARQLLSDVGLEHRLHHLPSELSGGERQRAAVARALVNDPQLILADEPTGNLDPANATVIARLLFDMVEKYHKTLVLVTHDPTVAKEGDIRYHIEEGSLRSL
ncbi:MAG: ABC transporter ATP-binding protein [Treponemataceae bacterium]|nr:ABC transporter ATP-binding protein [Treponemataceae bacterium]